MIKVLVADDEVPIRQWLEFCINKMEGYQVVGAAANGAEGYSIFRKTVPDIIITDIRMPVMDGIAATKAIRAMDRADAKTIPIIAMTANAFEEDAKRCLAAGMTAHLAKPFQIEDVEKTIVECCGK